MQLLDLPPELLVSILDLVGPDHFRKDVGSIAISKVWYGFARPVLLSCLHLSTSTLRAGLLRPLEDANTLAATQRYTTTVNIRLDPPRPDISSDEHHVEGLRQADAGLSQMGIDLEELGHVLHGFSQLRSLRIYPGQDELRVESRALSTLVSLQRGLTSLDIDLANVRYTDDGPRSHVCKSISGLMPSLVRLRCRLPYMCEELLDPTPGNERPELDKTGSGDKGPCSFPLEELIVNISISEWSSNVTSFTFAKHCSGNPRLLYAVAGPSLSPLQLQMSSLTSKCPKLSLVRLISHQMPSLDWYAFDALSGNKLRIPRGSSWDVEGELCTDEDGEDGANSETDLFDSGSETLG